MAYWHLNQAVRIVKSGGVIAYPTEAVFGLGCLPANCYAVNRILKLKKRPVSKGLILVAADIQQLEPFIFFPNETIRQHITTTWPGPVTWILPARPGVPVWIRGDHNSVAVRVSNHAIIHDLCLRIGPLVSTSANPASRLPAKTSLKVRLYFGSTIDYILPGKLGEQSQPTEIRDGISGETLRFGS